MVMYGRSEEDWDQLADAGLAFLVETRASGETDLLYQAQRYS